MAEKLTFDACRALEIAGGNDPDFEYIKEALIDNDRWAVHYEVIVQRKSDGKFFKSYYSRGATECQDHSPYEYDKPVYFEVKKVKKTIVVYETVKD